jgi:hypothetical protein
MSAVLEAQSIQPTTKKFGKGERLVPHHSQKAKKWYPAEDESQPKKVCISIYHVEAIPPSKLDWNILLVNSTATHTLHPTQTFDIFNSSPHLETPKAPFH